MDQIGNQNKNRMVLDEIGNNNMDSIVVDDENLKRFTNAHNQLIDDILIQEEDLIKQHEAAIDDDVQYIKKEMEYVEEVKREASS